MATLAGYPIANIQESFTNTVQVTAYPTEKGYPITDGVKRQPKTFSITGKIYSPGNSTNDRGAKSIYSALESKQNAGTVMTYVGRTTAKNVVIVDMQITNDTTVANGMQVQIDLQEIRIATSPWIRKKTTKKPAGKKTVTHKPARKSSKKFHKMKRGETYWKMSIVYHTPLGTLMHFPENHWPARLIPIGANVRVK